MSPACFIFMPVAAMVKVLPAPTAWASSVLPLLTARHTASTWCGWSEIVWFMPGKSRCDPSKSLGRRLLYVSL